jgi:hypothetical protein
MQKQKVKLLRKRRAVEPSKNDGFYFSMIQAYFRINGDYLYRIDTVKMIKYKNLEKRGNKES